MTSSADTSTEARLTQQRDNLSSLHGLLLEEKEALGKYQPEALEDVTERKNDLLNRIQALDESISSNPTAIEHIKSGNCDELMDEINTLLGECKSLNDVNGAAIQQSQITVNRIRTSILEGQGKSSLTYDEKAKTSTGVNTLNIKA